MDGCGFLRVRNRLQQLHIRCSQPDPEDRRSRIRHMASSVKPGTRILVMGATSTHSMESVERYITRYQHGLEPVEPKRPTRTIDNIHDCIAKSRQLLRNSSTRIRPIASDSEFDHHITESQQCFPRPRRLCYINTHGQNVTVNTARKLQSQCQSDERSLGTHPYHRPRREISTAGLHHVR